MKELKRLLPYLAKYKNRLYLGFLFVTISNICSTYLPRVVGRTIDTISHTVFSMEYIYEQIGVMILLTFCSGLFMYLTRQTIIYASRLIEYDMRRDLMEAIMYRTMDFFNRNSTGNLMAHSTNDVSSAREFIGPAVMYGANTITTFSFALYFMLTLGLEITLIGIFPLPIIAIATYYLGKKVHIASKAVQEEYGELSGQAQEAISGIRIIRAYNAQDSEYARFEKHSLQYFKKNIRLARLQSLIMPLLMVLVGFSFILVLYFGGSSVINGDTTIGELTQFFIYLTILIWPIAAIGWITNIIQRAAAAAARLGKMMESYNTLNEKNRCNNIEFTNGDIIFENVCFKYNDDEKNNVLDSINLKIPQSTSIGIIGSIGSGKTTLINILPALILPSIGKVTFGNIPLDRIDLNSLRENISIVPQDNFLFSNTILENIKFSRPQATMEEIEQAAKDAMLHEEILAFEKGYDTMLGERGITLSGGQKQRTSLARAMLRRPSILILDDALSAVDANTEDAILKNIKNIMHNQTTIICSHRISSVMHCTNIIVLKNGRIIEQGNHFELLKLCGYYANIYQKQKLESEIQDM